MKQETVIDRAPMVRCYKCGSPVVFSLCHHCARPMCEKHSPFAFRQAGTPVREAGDDARDAVKPASLEFAYVSSSSVKEVFSLGGDIAEFVPAAVLRKMKRKAHERLQSHR